MTNEKSWFGVDAKDWMRLFLFFGIVIALMMTASHAYASDGTEFQAATEKFEGWIQGNLGKLAAFVALAFGSIMAAIRKDWTWFMGAVVLSLGTGILVGIVNASFTATI